MKKTLIYILSLAVLLVAVYMITKQEKHQEKEAASNRAFAVEDATEVTRIFMADKANNRLDLKKKVNEWMVNDRHAASPLKVDVLLKTMEQLTVSYPVSKAQWNNVIRDLATKSTKVEIYKHDEGTPYKVYHVGGDTHDGTGTFMIMEVEGEIADRPYVIGIPGHQGILSPRFSLNELDWRDTEVFDYELEAIKQVRVEYFREPERSFKIDVVNRDSMAVFPLSDEKIYPSIKLYEEGVAKYLGGFEFLHVEAFLNDYAGKDSIIDTRPFVEVSVTDQSGETRKMTVFYMPINRRSKMQYDPQGSKLPYDLDRYYALINDGKDFVLIQDFVFGKIFRNYSDFFTKES